MRFFILSIVLRRTILFGFTAEDCLQWMFKFLTTQDLERCRTISKESNLYFKAAFGRCEAFDWAGTLKVTPAMIGHTKFVGNNCTQLKKVNIDMRFQTYLEELLPLFGDILRNNPNISDLSVSGMPDSIGAILASLKFPELHELTYRACPSFNPAILELSGQQLRYLNLGRMYMDLNLHRLNQACPNLEILAIPMAGLLHEAGMTAGEHFSKLTELLVWRSGSEAVNILRRAPNLEILCVRNYNLGLVSLLKAFSGKSLSLGSDCTTNSERFKIVMETLRQQGTVLPQLERFSTSQGMIAHHCADFAAVAPNVRVLRARKVGRKSLEVLQKCGIKITCLLTHTWSAHLAKAVAQEWKFPALKHISGNETVNNNYCMGIATKKRPYLIRVPFCSHFNSRFDDEVLSAG